MATLQELVVKGLIELELSGKGAADAKATMKEIVDRAKMAATDVAKIGDAGKKGAEGIGRMETALGGVGTKLAAVFGAAAVAQFLRGSVLEFARLERQINGIGFALEQMGVDAKSALPGIREALESLGAEKLEGALPAFQKFLTITKDTNAALAATKLAVDISERGITDLAGAADLVAAVMQGRAQGAAQQLGLQLVKLNGEVKDNAELMSELVKQYSGFASKVNDTQETLDRAEGSWKRIGRAIGASLALALNRSGKFAEDMADALFPTDADTERKGKEVGAAFESGLETILKQAGRKAARQRIEDEIQATEEGTPERLAAELELLEFERRAAVVESRRKYSELHTQAEAAKQDTTELEKTSLQEIASINDHYRSEESKKLKKFDDKRNAESKKAADKRAEDEERARLEANERELDADKRLEEARAEMLAETSAERYQLEVKRILDTYRELLSKTREGEEARKKLLEAYQAEIDATTRQFLDQLFAYWDDKVRESADAERDLRRVGLQGTIDDNKQLSGSYWEARREMVRIELEQELSNAKATFEQETKAAGDSLLLQGEALKVFTLSKLKIEKKAAIASVQLTREESQAKAALYLNYAGQATGLLQQIFSKNKAVAYANTVIHTAEAIMQAMASLPYPYNIVVAALTAAEGLVQLNTIRKQNLEGMGGISVPSASGAGVSSNAGAGGSSPSPSVAPSTDASTAGQAKGVGNGQAQANLGGRGFDNPLNDRMAYMMGRRSARDLTDNFDAGFRKSAAEVAAGDTINTSTDNSDRRVVNVTVHGMYGGREGIRALRRELARAEERDRPRRF